ncbi:MerR family transcriptional regulator [Nannocystis pusilla]|uniref:Helix-turn-helix domain-containing protein n=1 Tax=Nannocystis pusilla TaxID=889268 RepID=A0ABS7TN44_9BACT|nr:MerR family transcriptional regulator [Nannocystis pusilla]MBZ5709644.1 helix-turn-helix domain-containing protein [Nannocystis pusilla]
MTEDPKPLGKDYATTDEVSAVAGVERTALYEWLREGLLPRPRTSGGRGIIAKWPMITLELAKFVRSQRELAFGLPEIRPRILQAFGEQILEVLPEPRGPRRRAQGGDKRTDPRGNQTARTPGKCRSTAGE